MLRHTHVYIGDDAILHAHVTNACLLVLGEFDVGTY
jgi:hypothetical protein